jgi:hypothetical protein
VKLVVRLVAFNPAGKENALVPDDEDGVPDDADRWVLLLVVKVGVIGDMLVEVLKPDQAPPGKVWSKLKVDKAGRLSSGMGNLGDEGEPDEDNGVEAVDVKDDG